MGPEPSRLQEVETLQRPRIPNVCRRTQEEPIENAEHGGGHADPERQADHPRNKETRSTQQTAESEPQILECRCHGMETTSHGWSPESSRPRRMSEKEF